MSWSRAGPRRPAVKIFVLSGTGEPVALVKRSGFAIGILHFRSSCCRVDKLRRMQWGLAHPLRDFSALPLRTADDAAEIGSLEIWILVRQHIRFHVAECRVGL